MRYILLKVFTLLLMLGLVYSDEELVNLWGISPNLSQDGAGPMGILPGLPADISGLKNGDVITQVDGKKFKTVRELADIIRDMPARMFTVNIIRGSDDLRIDTYCLRVTRDSLRMQSQFMLKAENDAALPK